jgi:hypothetical protein
MAVSPASAFAQQAGLPAVSRDSSAGAVTSSAPHRFEQSPVGQARLGISLPAVAVDTNSHDPLAAYRAASLRHRGPGVALMIVGAAAIVTGLLIDESLITILGAGTGLVGLYLYLR